MLETVNGSAFPRRLRLLMILFNMVCSSVTLISMSCGHKQMWVILNVTSQTPWTTIAISPASFESALTAPASCLKRFLKLGSIWLSCSWTWNTKTDVFTTRFFPHLLSHNMARCGQMKERVTSSHLWWNICFNFIIELPDGETRQQLKSGLDFRFSFVYIVPNHNNSCLKMVFIVR